MLIWLSMVTLIADAILVIDLRVRQIAAGKGTPDGLFLMVTEKLNAATEARAIVLRGGTAAKSWTTTERLSPQTRSGSGSKATS